MSKYLNSYINNGLNIFFNIFSIKNIYAHKYIAKIIISQRKFLSLNIASGIGAAFFEVISISLLFFIIKLLSVKDFSSIDLKSYKFFNDAIANFLSQYSFNNIFLFFLIAGFFFQLLQAFALYINKLMSRYIEARCLSEVTSLIHKKILSLKFPFVSKFKVGDLSNYVSQCPVTIRFQIEGLTTIFVSSLISISYLLLLLNISFRLLILVLFVTFFVRLATKKLYPSIRKASNEATGSEVLIIKKVVENFQALRLIHISGMQNYLNDEIKSNSIQHERILRRKSRKLELINPLISFTPIIVICLISLFFSIDKLNANNNLLPILGTFFITLQRLNKRIGGVMMAYGNLQDNSSRITRLNQILSIKDDQIIRNGGLKLNSRINSIILNDVDFSYNKKDLVLKKINFEIKKGEAIALVGISGSGKSSIVDLLGGLYKPNAGEILINGMSINAIDLNDWRKRIAIVNQDTFLFNKSINSNLGFGNKKLSNSEIKKACKYSKADEFIEKLPESYNTVIGERGFKLSGGQRQRISIARAIAKNAEFLILDEATSALDSKTEEEIQNNLNRYRKGRIILIISHRLSTIQNVDKILVLEKGRIVESGKHDELILKKGLYQKLWKMQTKK